MGFSLQELSVEGHVLQCVSCEYKLFKGRSSSDSLLFLFYTPFKALELTWYHVKWHSKGFFYELLRGHLAQVSTHSYATCALQKPAEKYMALVVKVMTDDDDNNNMRGEIMFL